MRCPKCQFDHELQTTECLKCGIVFSRYLAAQEAAKKAELAAPPVQAPAVAPSPLPSAPPAEFSVGDGNDAFSELKYRALALPVALLVARMLYGHGLRASWLACSQWCCMRAATPSRPG